MKPFFFLSLLAISIVSFGQKVLAPITPNGNADTYGTHLAWYGVGGYRSVATIAERDAITSERREEGMKVFVLQDSSEYLLKGGIANSNWRRVLIPKKESSGAINSNQSDFYSPNWGRGKLVVTNGGSNGQAVGLGYDIKFDPKHNLYILLQANYSTDGTGHDIYASTSKDLLSWTNPALVFPRSGVTGRFDKSGVTAPKLYYDDTTGVWHLYYIGFPINGFEVGQSKTGHATTTDILDPTKYVRESTPILSASGWLQSNHYIFTPNVLKEGSTFYLFFNGGPYGDEHFGFATATNPAGPFIVGDTALIPDGKKAAAWCEDDFFSDPEVFHYGDKWYCMFWGRKGWAGTTDLQTGIMWTTEKEFPNNWRGYDQHMDFGLEGNPLRRMRPKRINKDGQEYLFYNDEARIYVTTQQHLFFSAENNIVYGGQALYGDTSLVNAAGAKLYISGANKLRLGKTDLNNSEGSDVYNYQVLSMRPSKPNQALVIRGLPSGGSTVAGFELFDNSNDEILSGRFTVTNYANTTNIGYTNNFYGNKMLQFIVGQNVGVMRLFRNGNVNIGSEQNDNGNKFQVYGTMSVQGASTLSSTTLGGKVTYNVTTAADANLVITDTMHIVVLPVITDTRVITLPAASASRGRTLLFYNGELPGSGNDWQWSIPAKAYSGVTNFSVLPPSSAIEIFSDGTSWIVKYYNH